MLRKAKVVGKFVEFYGEGCSSLSVTDRATIANMAPEYGATMGFFPVDEKTVAYFKGTGRTDAEIAAFEAYYKAQQMFGVPKAGAIDYSENLELDLSTVMSSLAGPKRPQDRINLDKMKSTFTELFSAPVKENGFAKKPADLNKPYKTYDGIDIRNGDVLIAAITSCTNTSNPGVLLAAGLLAKKAVELGLTVKPHIKTSLAPGSRVVTEYLTKAGPAALPGEARLLPRRLRLHHLHRQRRPARAADRGDHRQERAGVRRGALGQPQLRSAHPPEHPRQLPRLAAAGGGLRHRRLGAGGLQDPAPRQVEGRPGRLHRPHLADLGRDPGADEAGDGRADLPQALRRPRQREPAVQEDLGAHRAGLHLAEVHLHRRAALLQGLQHAARDAPGNISGAKILGVFGDSVTTDHISPGRLDQADLPRGHLPAGERRLGGGLQQLRRAPRQPRRHDARHLRQRAHQEPDVAAARKAA